MTDDVFAGWMDALEARHLADLRVPEVTRALRALSSAYVERRHTVARGAALDSRGKRAAFALFYSPLHFLVARHVVRSVGGDAVSSVVDIGCGTGAAGAAWALEAGGVPILGIDRHPWAVEEARWTYNRLGLSAQARTGDVTRLPSLRPGSGVVAAYVLNELPAALRERVEETLLEAATRGMSVLVLEPIARALTPWWEATARRFETAGGRADEWRFSPDLPPLVRLLDKAAGLNHQEMTARSLYCAGRRT
jgi:hypothetical protein